MDRGKALGQFIVQKRKEMGISQRELAKRVGIAAGYMSQIESGKRNWPQKYTTRIAEELGVQERELAVQAGLIAPVFGEDSIVTVASRTGGAILLDEVEAGDDKWIRLIMSFQNDTEENKVNRYINIMKLAVGALSILKELTDDDLDAVHDTAAIVDSPEADQIRASG